MGNLKDYRILKYQIGLLLILTISIGLINGQIDTGDITATVLPSLSTDDNQINKINLTTNQNDLSSTTEQMFEDSTLLPELSDPYWSSSMPSLTMMDSNSSKSSSSESSEMTTKSSSLVMPSTEKTLSVIPLKDPTPTKDSVNFDENETVSSSSSSSGPINNFWDFTTQFQKNYLEKLKQNSTNSNNFISMSDNESQTTTSSSSSSSSTTTSSSSLESMPVFRTTTTESTVTMMPEAKDFISSSTSQTMTATIAAAALFENNTSEQTDNKEDLKDSPIIFLSTTAIPENNNKQIVNDEQMKSLNSENIILPSSSDSKMMSAMEEEKQTTVQTMTINEEGETTHLPPSMLGEVSDENKQSEQSSSVSVVGSADKMMMMMGTDDNLRNNLSTEMLMDRETTIMPEMMGDLSSGVIINEIQMQKESHSSSTSDPESESSSSTSEKLMSSTESSSISSLQSESSPSPVFIVGSLSESKETVTTTPSSPSSQESENVLISSSSSSASSSTVESTMTTTPMPSESILPSVLVVSSESKGRALNLTEISSSTEMNEHQNHHHNQHDDMNMMTMEDGAGEQQQHHHQHVFHGEGRSADASDPLADEDPYHPHLNFVTTEKSAHYSMENNKDKMMKDLSDVSMDDDDVEIVNHLQHNNNNNSTTNNGTGFSNDDILARQSVSAIGAIRGDYDCIENGEMYKNGETMNRDCDEKCTCNNGLWICIPRCAGVFFKRGRTFADPLCHEKYSQEDECCATMICTETARNINEDLNSDLIIANSHNNNNESTSSTNAPLLPTIPPTLSSSMTPSEIFGCMHNGVMYRPRERLEIGCEQICFCESDGNMNCRKRCPDRQHTPQEKCVLVKDPKDICCQLEFCDVTLDGHEQTEPPSSSSSLSTSNQNSESEEDDFNNSSSLNDVKPIINGTVLNDGCKYKDNIYKFGEQFHDGCDALCICTQENVHCAQLECPTTFGLDVLDPHCLKWEPEPSTFKAIPPKCCPERMRCVNNGSCEYEGTLFDNWAEIPSNLTGCEKHCYCEGGKVQCRPACAPVQALPPAHLPCHPKDVRLLPIPDDPCCKRWTCVTNDVSNIDYNDNKHKGHKDKIKSQSSSELDDNGKDSNSVGPFYPTIDGKPPKTQLEKPTKNKFNKDNKDVTGNNVVQQYPIPTSSSSSSSQPIIKNDVKYDQPFVPIIAQLPTSQTTSPQQQREINNHNEQLHQHPHHHHQQQQQQLQKQQYAIEQQQQQQHHSDNTIGSRQPPITSIQYDLNNNNHRQQQGFNFFDQSQNPNKNQYGGGGGGGGGNIEFNNNRHNPYLHDIGIDLSGHHEPNGIIIASGKPSQTELYNILGQNGGNGNGGGIGLGPINTGDNHGLPPPPLPPSLSNQHQQHQHHRQQQQQQQQQHDTSHLPPHIRIEHILQHLQSNEPNQIQQQQQQHHNNNNNNNNREQKFPIQIGPNHHSHFPINNRGQLDSLNGNVGGINNSPATQIIHIPISASDGTNHGLPFNSFTIHQLSDSIPGPVSASAGGQSISPNNIIEQQQQQQQPHGTLGLPINQRLPSLPSLLPTPSQTGDFFTNPNANSNLNSISPNLEVLNLEAIDPNTVRIVFRVPPVYVNLHGRVELRYTNGPSNDTATWEQQIFAPPEDLIATSQLEFELPNLEPNSLYKIQITLLLRDLGPQPTSGIHTIETPPRTITPPTAPTDYRPDFENIFKNIEDPELNVSESNSTWLRLSWKKLPDNDLEYVDGVQLRYKELDGMLYDATPLIHRTLTSYTLENLQENTAYEIGLYYIPFPGNGAELRAGNMITVRTAPKVDVYGFDVMVNVTKVKSTSVEVSWNGVPYPEDKYVNIYRAIYQSDAGKEDSSVFKVAKRDSTTGTLIMDLKPGTRYRLWLETYLTNGKIKKSNVVNFVTKPGGPAPVPGKTGKLLTAGESQQPVGDYYGPLVVVAVVAALAVMSTLILLTILTRRRTHHTASITPPRKSEAAYDNPSYKVEIQQETMNL